MIAKGVFLFFSIMFGILVMMFLQTDPPALKNNIDVQNLENQVTILGLTDNFPTISATNKMDEIRALGFLHATKQPWLINLLRQTAEGRLTEWFGAKVKPIDEDSRRLGFAAYGQETYRQLSDEHKAYLQAYADGINAAFNQENVAFSDELILLNIIPAKWQPEHSLYIERLITWLGTTTNDNITPLPFQENLKLFLHLHGFEKGIIWSSKIDNNRMMYIQNVYGNTALSLFMPVKMQRSAFTISADPILLVTVPGTLMFPAGQSKNKAWSYLLNSTAQIRAAENRLQNTRRDYERYILANGDELISEVIRLPNKIIYASPQADSIIVRSLGWSGLSGNNTDLNAWLSLYLENDQVGLFKLLRGDGMLLYADSKYKITGRPAYRNAVGSREFVLSNSPWSRLVAHRLTALKQAGQTPGPSWLADATSSWAQDLLVKMKEALDTTQAYSPAVNEALEYLNNWNYSYANESIAAAIFDTWAQSYADATEVNILTLGNQPFQSTILVRTLSETVRLLSDQNTSNTSLWRWEMVQSAGRQYPVWSADSLLTKRQKEIAKSRYADIKVLDAGHPSAIFTGVQVGQSRYYSPAIEGFWFNTQNQNNIVNRNNRIQLKGNLLRWKEVEMRSQVIMQGFSSPIQITLNPN